MSHIQKLMIQGIRSFGPHEEDRQVIVFKPPLTLILGHNGCGKTTIIECLKYVATGGFPTGTNNGKSFVCDPKMVKEPLVKGQVRLQFMDVKKKQVIAIRSLEVTQKPASLSVRTLDGTLKRLLPDGTSATVSSKCADINAELSSALGVSKAVLNNVIFCHQEDSNWPLDEGGKVKDKFDEIFSATQYIKCLERIRSVRKFLKQRADLLQKSLGKETECKEEAKLLRGNIAVCEAQVATSKNTLSQFEARLVPLNGMLAEIVTTENNIGKIQMVIRELETQLKENVKSQANLLANIKSEVIQSPAQLDQILMEFKMTIRDKENQLAVVKSQLDTLDKHCSSIITRMNKSMEKIGRLDVHKKSHEAQILDRDQRLRRYADNLNLVVPAGEITSDCAETVLDQVRNWVDNRSREVDDIQREFESVERSLQTDIDKLREERSKFESQSQLLKNEMEKNRKELKDISKKAMAFRDTDSTDEINAKIETVEKQLSELATEEAVKGITEDVNGKSKEIEDLEVDINNIDVQLSERHKEGSVRLELDLFRKDRDRKLKVVDKLKNKHQDSLCQIFAVLPEQDFSTRLGTRLEELGRDVQKTRDSLNSSRNKLSGLESDRKASCEQLAKKEEEVRVMKEQLYSTCGDQDLDSSIDKCMLSLKSLQEKKSSLGGATHLFQTYISKLGNRSPCCPLCNRSFQELEEAKQLSRELESQIRRIPHQIEEQDRLLGKEQKNYDSLIELKPVRDRLLVIKNEIPDLEQTIQNLNIQLKGLNEDIASHEDTLMFQLSDEDTIKSMQTDMVIMDQTLDEIESLNNKLSSQESLLSGVVSEMSVEDLNEQKQSKKNSRDTLKAEIKALNAQLTLLNRNASELQKKLNNLVSEKLKALNQAEEKNRLEERRKQVLQDISVHEESLKALTDRLKPVGAKLKEALDNKETVCQENKNTLAGLRNSARAEADEFSFTSGLQDKINKFLLSGKLEELRIAESEVANNKKDLSELKIQKEALESEYTALSKSVTNSQIRNRELQDNKELLNRKEEERKIEEDLSVNRSGLSSFDVREVKEKRRSLTKQLDDIHREKHRKEGELQEKQETLKSFQRRLKEDKYANAEKNYMMKVVRIRTMEMAVEDLNTSYKALDWAIMQFHQEKMRAINLIVKELWKLTYKGNDIDSIQIKTTETNTAAGADKRKSYNYRVVMVRNNTEMDMRGRCSAGQKVLASLIIRIALAETFGSKCSVLALDEPTTNLDRANIESLSMALLDIVEKRSTNVNFQLIVITHDEEFLGRLCRREFLEYYYRVSRNEEGFSCIKKCSINDE